MLGQITRSRSTSFSFCLTCSFLALWKQSICCIWAVINVQGTCHKQPNRHDWFTGVVTKNPDNVVTNSLCSGVLIIGVLLLSQTLWQFLKRKEGPFYIPAASAFPLWIMLLIPLTVVQRGGKALSSRCRVFRACELCYSRETLLPVPPVGEFREESLLGCGPSPTKLLALGRLPGSVAASF